MAIGTVWADNTWDDDAWADDTWADAGAGLGAEGDMNTRILQYLRNYYTAPTGELTPLATRYLNELTTGDRTQKWHALVTAATNAM